MKKYLLTLHGEQTREVCAESYQQNGLHIVFLIGSEPVEQFETREVIMIEDLEPPAHSYNLSAR